MSNALSDHEVVTFQRVQDRLDELRDGMPVKQQGPLSGALDKLSCIPFVSFGLDDHNSLGFQVEGNDAGTLGKPKTSVISEHSKPSAYGKGEETVIDETYRLGREVLGADIKFDSDWKYIIRQLERVVTKTLFVGRRAHVKLYKLVVYKKGGHFDWHMDSTHSKEHHATVLVALNSKWSGGDLILRRNGVEMRLDMKPKKVESEWSSRYTSLGAVAFYTDTEHKVEPVTSGTRIVLQYDVEVKNWSSGKSGKAEEGEEQHTSEDANNSDSADEEDDEMDIDYDQCIYDNIGGLQEVREAQQELSIPVGDPTVVYEILAILQQIFDSGQEEVAFALQYLYRKSSILPEFLKGSDSLLYQALVNTQVFHVSLHPVVLQEVTDHKGHYNAKYSMSSAHIFEHSGTQGNSDSHPKKQKKKTEFHISRTSALQRISHQDYIEYTGNEAQTGENTYFGGGMFVKLKREIVTRSRAKKSRS